MMRLLCAAFSVFAALTIHMGSAHAAAAIAYDSTTGAYGYVYGYKTHEGAKAAALKGCGNRAGPNCQIINSCAQGGYGFIYRRRLSDGTLAALGTSCGYGSIGQANDAARITCNKLSPDKKPCSIAPFWYDQIDDGHVEEQCKDVLPGNDPCYAPLPTDDK